MPRLSKIGAAALGAFGWTGLNTISASYLVVAGGGGAGSFGGGGAGGFLTGTTSLNPLLSYTVTVGAGGAGVVSGPSGGAINGSNGSNSQFGTLTASVGGGGGGGYAAPVAGSAGGSGGGGGYSDPIGSALGGAGTSGQGNAGGSGFIGGAGGGGASAVGSNGGGSGIAGVGGAGGNGTASSISGTSTTYAGGGGGGNGDARGGGSGGAGGTGGGGAGSTGTGTTGAAGTANLGGGGGGGGSGSGTNYGGGGQGGSGVVIISYVGAQQFGGGVVTTSGGNTIHTFNTSGTLSPLSSLTASSLVVAGGGGGGFNGGGGGAGGYRTGSGITLDTNSTYLVTVGSGGTGGSNPTGPTNGGDSVFNSITSTGGGGGGCGGSINPASGGSGGGSGFALPIGNGNTPSTSPSQGNNGGLGYNGGLSFGMGGGGGASAVGVDGTSTTGGNGGAGTANSISGTSVTYAGGGGGGIYFANTPGSGGAGGGGAGGANGSAGTAGTVNRGGGGGGGGSNGSNNPDGGNGGSGVVIISYPGSVQQMAGGTVTVAGGNVIHTFTSSGYLAPIFTANNSLRFRSSASAYLNRTPASAGNRRTWTWSGWVKRGALTTASGIMSAGTSANDWTGFRFNSDDTFAFYRVGPGGGTTTYLNTTQVFRDPSSWYHIVLQWDTTQDTSSNRIKLYINGVQVTAFASSSYPTLNYEDAFMNTAIAHLIGNITAVSQYLDGYLAEVNFVDGLALTPNSFGTSNGLGVWQPIRYGGSYGTNGFYLPFTAGTSTFIGSYNGSTAWFNAANNAAFAFGTGSLTVEAWVYPTQNSYGAIFDTRSTGSGGPGMSIYANSGNGIILVNNTTYNPSTYLSLNQWSHIAAVRNGASSWTVYINGNSVLTFTDSSNLTDNACFSGKNYAGTFFFGGFISNLRVVKGTAVYTSNFTPATSPLTNISGTSLLTLQNSTLIDNSTNAFSLTNTGPITTLGAYIFNFLNGTFKDNSPQGNNWTYNSISTAFGSSCDLMTDVPTNTSATVANYAVMNPLTPVKSTLLDGNLRTNGGDRYSIATIGMSSGKWYAEMTVTTAGTESSCGIATQPDVVGAYVGNNANSWGYYNSTGDKYTNTTPTAYGATYTTGDVIGIAFDADAGTLTFYKNNTSQGTAFTGLTSGPYYFAMSGRTSGTANNCSINFGQRPFVYTPPTNFKALNTFNLSTPTIGATAATTANKYFDVLTWSGVGGSSGATRSITGLNFQPDFLWEKSRTSGTNHQLLDVLRGVGQNKVLASNSTGSEPTPAGTESLYGWLSSFNSDGFTTTNGTSTWDNWNKSGDTYVAWNWKANGAGVTNTAGSITSTVSASTTAGFSIVTYTGTGSNATVGHGLGVAPSMIIIKNRSTVTDWPVYHGSNTTSPATQRVLLNTTDATATSSTYWNNTAPTSSVFSISTYSGVNGNTNAMVAYCFAQVAGYSAFGSYTGNGVTDGPFVYLGFRPRFVMIKRTDSSGNWNITDTAINPYNNTTGALRPNTFESESTVGTVYVQPLSNGFKITNNNTDTNGSGTYIYMAFAESPFKYANAR